MPFDIAKFSQNISEYGVLKTNSFDVNIALPPMIANLASNSAYSYINQFNELQPFRASYVGSPSVAFRTNETHNRGVGPRIKQPVEVIHPNLPISFLADSEGIIESFFTLWMNLGINYSFNSSTTGSIATYYTNYRQEYVSPTITINKYDRYGNNVSSYYVTDASPLMFVPSNLSWDEHERLQSFMVQLSYVSYDIN